MDTEFHYYMTGMIAHAAGFTQEEAKIIAYASEYTDENDEKLQILDKVTDETYQNFISQTMNILKPKQNLMRIYPVFHFVPGDYDVNSTRRKDGKMHLLVTTPNNEIANALIDNALSVKDETRLHRIGIATHSYSDTWAHQNFVGWYDYFNNIGFNVKPDIGHADAGHHPDWPSHRWEDNRLVESEIHNSVRFLEASENIYRKYRESEPLRGRQNHQTWDSLREKLINAMGTPFSGSLNWYESDRIKKYRKMAPWLGKFDETQWFNEAIEKNRIDWAPNRSYCWRDDIDKEKTDWFLFQESVKAHQRLAMSHLESLFNKMGVSLHNH